MCVRVCVCVYNLSCAQLVDCEDIRDIKVCGPSRDTITDHKVQKTHISSLKLLIIESMSIL